MGKNRISRLVLLS